MSDPKQTTAVITGLPEKMRAHAAAKALGMTSKELLTGLVEAGIVVKSAQSTVTREDLLRWAGGDSEDSTDRSEPEKTSGGRTRRKAGRPQDSPQDGTDPSPVPADDPAPRKTTRSRGPRKAAVEPVFVEPGTEGADRSTTDIPAVTDPTAAPEAAPTGDTAAPGRTGQATGGRRRKAATTTQPAADTPRPTVSIVTGEVGTAEPEGRRRRSTATPSFSPLFLSLDDTDSSTDDESADADTMDGSAGSGGADRDDENTRPRRRGRRGRGRGRGDAGADDAADSGDRGQGDRGQGDADDRSGGRKRSEDRDSRDDSDTRDPGAHDAGADPDDTARGDSEDSGDRGRRSDNQDGGEQGSSRRRRRRRSRRGGGGGDESANGGQAGGGNSGGGDDGSADRGETSGRGNDDRDGRRRSRGGQGSGGSSHDDTDEVQGISGSTRLEAKRQRRRDGREAGRRRQPILSEAQFLARRESVDRVMVVRERVSTEGRGLMTQVGVLEDDVLVEHFVTTESARSMVGNVYLGRVQNVLPSMEAAFVDIGRGRNGVLYAGEVNWEAAGLGGRARRIEQALRPGDLILVQVTKDPIGQKGARLTTQISLAGRFLVYVPDGNSTGISRKLPDTERRRLKAILKEVVPDGSGVIIRTAAEGVSEAEIGRDVDRLAAQWEQISTDSQAHISAGTGQPVSLYEEPDLLVKVVRDLFNEDFSKLVIEGQQSWDTVHDYVSTVAPEMLDRLERYTSREVDVFTTYRVDEQLAKALERKVWLPSGGSLVIDRTEAMTVIDVNTGKFTGSGGNLEETVTKNNLEAAEEIVRQLRLRDIGGMIVIDFIDMVLESNRDLILRRLTEALGRDRTRHQVSEVTSLGLVQLTRKKLGTGLVEAFSTPCEHCQGRGLVIHADPVHTEAHSDDDSGSRRGRKRGKPAVSTDQPRAKTPRRTGPAPAAHPAIVALQRNEDGSEMTAEEQRKAGDAAARDSAPVADDTPAESGSDETKATSEAGAKAGSRKKKTTTSDTGDVSDPQPPTRSRSSRSRGGAAAKKAAAAGAETDGADTGTRSAGAEDTGTRSDGSEAPRDRRAADEGAASETTSAGQAPAGGADDATPPTRSRRPARRRAQSPGTDGDGTAGGRGADTVPPTEDLRIPAPPALPDTVPVVDAVDREATGTEDADGSQSPRRGRRRATRRPAGSAQASSAPEAIEAIVADVPAAPLVAEPPAVVAEPRKRPGRRRATRSTAGAGDSGD